MTDTSGWSPAGIVSLVAIAAGIVLLVAYAVRRGMFGRELDGTDEDAALQAADDPTALGTGTPARTAPSTHGAQRPTAGRPMGILGAVVLVIGLALGVLVATGTWGASGPTPPAGTSGQGDCAAGWEGCPKATPQQ